MDLDKESTTSGPRFRQTISMALCFRDSRINISKKTMEALGMPGYVHLLIDRGQKWLFLKACERDKDAINVYYTTGEGSELFHYQIIGKTLLSLISGIMGVGRYSDSLRLLGSYLPDDEAVYFDMNRYDVIPYGEENSNL